MTASVFFLFEILLPLFVTARKDSYTLVVQYASSSCSSFQGAAGDMILRLSLKGRVPALPVDVNPEGEEEGAPYRLQRTPLLSPTWGAGRKDQPQARSVRYGTFGNGRGRHPLAHMGGRSQGPTTSQNSPGRDIW